MEESIQQLLHLCAKNAEDAAFGKTIHPVLPQREIYMDEFQHEQIESAFIVLNDIRRYSLRFLAGAISWLRSLHFHAE